jgi:hypothetical protein
MTVAAHPATQTRPLSLAAVRRTTTALTSPRPKSPFERRPDAKPAHALDRRGSYSPVSSARLRLTALRSDARDLPAIYKSP